MLRKILLALLVLAVIGAAVAYYLYSSMIGPAVVPEDGEAVMVQIEPGSSYDDVVQLLDSLNLIPDPTAFGLLAERMNYKRDPMRSGRFAIEPGTRLLDMIRQLRNGKQSPVAVVLTTEREPLDVAAKAARFLEFDSLELVTLFQDEAYLDSINYTPETLMTLFIPNTYEMYWNSTPREFVARMQKEHDRFWSQDDRRAKAQTLNLSPVEVYTLASIVEKETLRNDEKKRMAGVYYNRVEIGMPLQADPTAVFASRDFTTTRVTNYHLSVDSPYNTYIYAGLPPGPIAMSSISSIDAVLNVEEHDYLYFCAKGDGSGYHNFAKTLSAHNRNAATYRANLRKRGKR